jgi:colicin import membrane protein
MKTPGRGGSGSSLSLSILLHGLLAGGIFAAWWWNRTPEPAGERLALTATVVESAAVKTPPPPEPQPAEPLPEPEPEAPAPPVPDEASQKAEAEALAKAAEEVRVAEERRIAAERAEAERQAQEKAERERAEKEKAAREKAERERLAREKAEKDKAERERRAKAEAEKARAAREAELNAQLAAEERLAAARASGQMAQYISQITAKIERAWNRPPSATAGLQCEVRVTQVQGGVVTGVKVERCNGDAAVRQSIEDAVYRASPLPQPPDPALFERNLVVTFRPDN